MLYFLFLILFSEKRNKGLVFASCQSARHLPISQMTALDLSHNPSVRVLSSCNNRPCTIWFTIKFIQGFLSEERKKKHHGIRVLKLIKSSYVWPQCNQNSWNLTLGHWQMFSRFCPWCTRGSNEPITRLVSLAALHLRKEFNNLQQRKQAWLFR